MGEVEARMAVLEEQVAALKAWQEKQNGSLQRIGDAIIEIRGSVADIQIKLAGHVNRILAGVAIACILFAVDIAFGRG